MIKGRKGSAVATNLLTALFRTLEPRCVFALTADTSNDGLERIALAFASLDAYKLERRAAAIEAMEKSRKEAQTRVQTV